MQTEPKSKITNEKKDKALHSDACRKLFNSLKSAMCILQNVFGSQFPILLALFEYGFVLYLKKVVKIADQDEAKIFEEKIKKLDLVTMIFSLCFFMMFASVYWIVALTSA